MNALLLVVAALILAGCERQYASPDTLPGSLTSVESHAALIKVEGPDAVSLVAFAALPGTMQDAAVAAITYLRAKGDRAEDFYLSDAEYDGRTVILSLWPKSALAQPMTVDECRGGCRDLYYDAAERRIVKELPWQ